MIVWFIILLLIIVVKVIALDVIINVKGWYVKRVKVICDDDNYDVLSDENEVHEDKDGDICVVYENDDDFSINIII